MGSRTLEYLPVADLPDDPVNPKDHVTEEIADSISRFGFNEPVVIDERTGLLLSGHGRKLALLGGQAAGGLLDPSDPSAPRTVPEGIEVADDGRWLVPVVRGVRSENDDEARAMLVAFNRLTEKGGWTNEGRDLASILSGLDKGPGLAGTGYSPVDLAGLLSSLAPAAVSAGEARAAKRDVAARNLAERFGAPPFSVLDSRQGYWKDRKRNWLDLGIDSGEGRTQNTLAHSREAEGGRRGRNGSMPTSYSAADPSFYAKKREVEELLGRELDTVEFSKMARDMLAPIATTSVFDPVLCELVYRWWAPPGGLVLDPFAGGSVRGVVAGWTGRSYVGVDLRPEQVDENRRQWADISAAALGDTAGPDDNMPEVTPIEMHGGHLVKRDDVFAISGSRGGKVRTCWHLAQGAEGLCTAGSIHSPQVGIVAAVARRLGIPCRVHVPAGGNSADLRLAQAEGAELVRWFPGHNSVIVARAREDAAARGWRDIPFGMECDEAVRQTATQVSNIPADVPRIVMPVGSGMSLAGVVAGLREAGRHIPILGVVVGADPTERLDKYAPGWQDMVELVDAGVDYKVRAKSSRLGNLALDPIYEAKCLPFLRPGDLLWVVGVRQGGVGAAADLGDVSWVVGDSRDAIPEALGVAGARQADFLFSCPPYYDLERYSDDPADLSNLGTYAEFRDCYREIIGKACEALADDRFACFVVGEVRSTAGNRSKSGGGGYVGFVPDTIAAFRAAGLDYHNDAVFLTPLGSIPVRAASVFRPNRRLAKVHQNVLVFCKGDPGRAAAAVGEVEAISELPAEET